MSAVGDYIKAVRDRLVALHLADTAWAGTTAADRTKVRAGNYIVRDGSTRQNFKRVPGQALAPGDLPLADFRFRGLAPAAGQVNPWGQSRTFQLFAGANSPGITAHLLSYRVTYKALTEDQATGLLYASEVLLSRAGAKLANAGASLAALPYCGGAGVTTAACEEREENGQLLTILDCEIAVAVFLAVGPDLLGT